MIPIARAHRNCTFILPSRIWPATEDRLSAKDPQYRWMLEATHGCWCSAWKVELDGSVLKWSDERLAWEVPKPWEHYLTTNDPYDRR